MFAITGHKEFSLTFANGNTCSVQWGPGNYGDHRNLSNFSMPKAVEVWKSGKAEIAAWDQDGVWYHFGYDDVKGWCTADQVASFIHFVATKNLTKARWAEE